MHNNNIEHKKYNIILVDDTIANLVLLTEMLQEQGYKARPLPSGKRALQAAIHEPPDLFLLDINMPKMNGFELCIKLKENPNLIDIPVIFISAIEESLDKVKAFKVGGVDFISKPYNFIEVNARVETHLKLRNLQLNLEELVQAQIKEISDSQMSTIVAIAKLAEFRDDDTGKHVDRVRMYCRVLSEELRENPRFKNVISNEYIDNIYNAASLHDLGKVGVKDEILLKPGKLTPEEFDIMRLHTITGSETLEFVKTQYPNNKFINMGILIARSHHERWDGSGYPDGLKKDEIPISARIVSLADVYDALRSKRPYKKPFSHKKSKDIILESSELNFDPDVVKAFNKCEKEFEKINILSNI